MSENGLVTSFVDLDDTLFSSLRRHVLGPDLEPAASLDNGDIISYSNSKQRFLRELLEDTGHIVPVTARNIAAYRRVIHTCPGPAILSHGATILDDDGTINLEWQEQIHTQLNDTKDVLFDFMRRIESSRPYLDQQIRSWLVYDESLPVYAVIKDNARDENRLQLAVRDIAGEWLNEHSEYGVHHNGNNVAILAPSIRKENAVAFLIQKIRSKVSDAIFIGVGDSISDEPFMRLCDFYLLLNGTQLSTFLAQAIRDSSAVDFLTSDIAENKP
jgi:hydroxymethylpyrimidine pyrophosphatase-like HAD family hydrolase